MAFKRKISSAPSQNFMSSDVRSGNNKNGVGVVEVSWPSQKISPTPVTAKPQPLSNSQTATVCNDGTAYKPLG